MKAGPKRERERRMQGLSLREICTPVGSVRIYIQNGYPLRVTIGEEGIASVPYELRPPALVEEMEKALTAYFAGGGIERELVLRLLGCRSLTPFVDAVYRQVLVIPQGSTLSYGEVAEAAGFPRAARAVGNAMRNNHYPIFVPCHRVVRADGRIGGYGGREEIKFRLLAHEGVEFTG